MLKQRSKWWYYSHQVFIIAISFVLTILLMAFMNTAFGAEPQGYQEAHSSFKAFLIEVSNAINTILAPASNARKFVEAEFIFFFIIRFVTEVSKWALASREASLTGVYHAIIMAVIVQILIEFYDSLTSLLLNLSGDLGGAIQKPILGTDDIFYAVSWISSLIDRITLPDADIWDSMKAIILLALTGVMVWGLSLVAFFCVAWSIWGFALAKLLGWFFIPFLMLDSLSKMFDGWVRFMVGFLIYGVVARVNLALVILLCQSFFNIPTGTSPTGAITISGDTFSNLGGLLALCLVSIFAMLSTGKFAMAISGSMGGFGGQIASIARVAVAKI